MYITVLRPKERSLLYIFFFLLSLILVVYVMLFLYHNNLAEEKKCINSYFHSFPSINFFLNVVPSIRGNSGNFLSWSKFWSFFLVLAKQCMANTAVRKINKWVMISNNVCLILAVFCTRGNSQYIYIKTPILLTPR